MSFLELSNVTKGFGGAPVLANVSLSIEKGEFVAIVGYSGSGKTTLISLIAGLLRPAAGQLTWDIQLTQIVFNSGLQASDFTL